MSDNTYSSIVKDDNKNLTRQLKGLLEKYQKFDVQFGKSQHEDLLDIYGNGKIILSARYEILGVYDIGCNLFMWGKNLQIVDRQLIKISKKIKKNAVEIQKMILKKKYSDTAYLEKLLYYSRNNIFFISP